MQFNGVNVFDNPFDSGIPIQIEHAEVTVPLQISGTNIFLETCTPTQHELDNCPHIALTCDSEWNPQTMRLASTRSVAAENTESNTLGYDYIEPGLAQISSIYSFTAMAESLHQLSQSNSAKQRCIKAVDIPSERTFISQQRHSAVSAEQLSERWNIGLDQAKQTIKVTTQCSV